jgi:hypothetical protein
MRIRHVLAAGSLAITLPLASGSAQGTAPEPPQWSFSLGVDPTHFDLGNSDSGVEARMVANLTRSWQSTNSRLGRHISMMLGTDAPRETKLSPDPQCYCSTRYTMRYAGLTAGASYNLFSAWRFTPYVTGGTGIYYTSSRREPTDDVLTTAEFLGYYQNGFVQKGFSVGLNGGLGLKVRLGKRELFIEQMLHSFDIGELNRGVYPLNIGIRF